MKRSTAESFLILESSRSSRCAAWVSHLQSAIDFSTSCRDDRSFVQAAKLECNLWGATSTKWTIHLQTEADWQSATEAITSAYQEFLDLMFTRHSGTVIAILGTGKEPACLTADVDGNEAGTLMQRVATGEFLHATLQQHTASALEQHCTKHVDLRTTLQHSAVLKHQFKERPSLSKSRSGSQSSSSSILTPSSGISIRGTIRKRLKAVKW